MFLINTFNIIKYPTLRFFLNLLYMVYKTDYYKTTEKSILELLELECKEKGIDEVSKIVAKIRIKEEFSLPRKEILLNEFLSLEKAWRSDE